MNKAHTASTPSSASRPQVHGLFDPATWTVTYVVHDGPGTPAAIVDPVLDYDPKSGRTRTASADKVIDYVQANDLKVEWILETHAHADHLSAAPYLKKKLGGRIGIGGRITQVQQVFKGIFNMEASFKLDGSQFDHLFADGDTINVGAASAGAGRSKSSSLRVLALATVPGRTLVLPPPMKNPIGPAMAVVMLETPVLSCPLPSELSPASMKRKLRNSIRRPLKSR